MLDRAVEDVPPVDVKGRVIQVVGTIVRASVPGVKVGEVCILRNPWEDYEVQAEVVGFTKDAALLTALGTMSGISGETQVIPTRHVHMVPVGDTLLGRVLDGLGRPMDVDKKGPLRPADYYPVLADPPSPLERRVISKPISLGIRALDGLITCGEGQRLGIFAAAGGGKSTLMAQIVRNTSADVTVMALIGERGREVREFIEKDLGEEGMRKSVVVCSTSDRSSMERLKAAYVATSIAEYFRDKGKKVLLLDFDMRRASSSLYVEKTSKGVSSYLSGKEDDWRNLVVPMSEQEGMYVLPVGALPPNPAELLTNSRTAQLIKEMREDYDIVFVDCPPVEIVADASIIAKMVDQTIFVVRVELMEREMLPVIDNYYKENKFPNMTLLLNGSVNSRSRYGYRYGYGYGYSYGYGYGYGHSYGNSYYHEDK